MPCISTKRSCERKKASLGEARRTTVHQADHTGMNTVKHLTLAKKDTANQSIAGEKHHVPGKKNVREVSTHHHQTMWKTSYKKHQKQP
jgi:hypothetical protein